MRAWYLKRQRSSPDQRKQLAQDLGQGPEDFLFVEIPQLISCRITTIMDPAAVPPGQPGQNGHARARDLSRCRQLANSSAGAGVYLDLLWIESGYRNPASR